jgi:hypothetical protein
MVRGSRASWIIVLALLAFVLGVAGCASTRADPCDPCPKPTEPPCPPVGELPPEAGPGEAWCRIWIPPVYGTETETVCVEPASSEKVWIPPTYGTRPKIVCYQEPQLREKVVPAVWGIKKREVMVCPPRERWQRICCPPSELAEGERQGECWTKIECPPVYESEDCPVCLEPERRCVEYTPAQYKVVEERFLLEPGRCEVKCIPARYEERCREVCIEPGRWEWRRNEACEVPEPEPVEVGLPALQVEMTDKAATGEEAGVFGVGDVVRYDLTVVSDEGATAMPDLKVVFTLPPELEFISGGGDGLDMSGEGQSAATTTFGLAVGQTAEMHILCRVIASPATHMAQLTASVQTADGQELATETESTTLKPAP